MRISELVARNIPDTVHNLQIEGIPFAFRMHNDPVTRIMHQVTVLVRTRDPLRPVPVCFSRIEDAILVGIHISKQARETFVCTLAERLCHLASNRTIMRYSLSIFLMLIE